VSDSVVVASRSTSTSITGYSERLATYRSWYVAPYWHSVQPSDLRLRRALTVLTEQDLRKRVGPILTDGTSIRELIDFDRHEVKMRTLIDPEVFRLELERIFARSWVFLAHDSELPQPGDFVMRYIGIDPVLVTRAEDGSVHVLLNVCAHRGMQVCMADKGSSPTFKCPYHGWVFDSRGDLLGAPFEREMYGDWDKTRYGLARARLTVRHGLIFGCFDGAAPSFEDYMGDLLEYFDPIWADAPEWETWFVRERLLVHGNWKAASDQVAGDGYHGWTLHSGMREIMQLDQTGTISPMSGEDVRRTMALNGAKVSVRPQGHAVQLREAGRAVANELRAESSATTTAELRAMQFLMFPSSHGGDQSMSDPERGSRPRCPHGHLDAQDRLDDGALGARHGRQECAGRLEATSAENE
jgi:phenylpropionate dioxygenase-like ring-hydroxylating dioxygenase large terminal subunit